MVEKRFEGDFQVSGKVATKSFAPGTRVYGERTEKVGKDEYRLWDPYRSKLSAAILKGLREMPIAGGSNVLYLGAASGTTASHVSDIVGEKGLVYCVEFAPRSMRDLLGVCEVRKNMLPVMADARRPEDYAKYIKGKVDVIYEDVADPSQAGILLANARAFLKKGGWAMFAIKSQSIDVAEQPKKTYEKVIAELEGSFEILERMDLQPFDKDHLFLLAKFK